MLVLFILGAFGIKAAVVVYAVFRFAKWLSQKGDTIKQGYENQIADLKAQNKRLRSVKSYALN